MKAPEQFHFRAVLLRFLLLVAELWSWFQVTSQNGASSCVFISLSSIVCLQLCWCGEEKVAADLHVTVPCDPFLCIAFVYLFVFVSLAASASVPNIMLRSRLENTTTVIQQNLSNQSQSNTILRFLKVISSSLPASISQKLSKKHPLHCRKVINPNSNPNI